MSFLCVHMNRIINGLCEAIIYCNYYLQFNLLPNYLLAVSSMELQLNVVLVIKLTFLPWKKGFISLTNYLLFLWNTKFFYDFFLFFDSFSTEFYSCYLCNSNNNLFLSTAASIMQRKALGLIGMKCSGIPFWKWKFFGQRAKAFLWLI